MREAAFRAGWGALVSARLRHAFEPQANAHRLDCEMRELPLPAHFDPGRVGEVWRVPYEDRAHEARAWAEKHGLARAAEDSFRLCLLAVDVQNTFCIPDFELFVGGRSGRGAVDDCRRLAEFLYRNVGVISQVLPSLDTHRAMQVFHAIWLVDDQGEHPGPYTLVSAEDVESGRWRVNPAVADALGLDRTYAERHLAHYARRLAEGGKYELTIWPYHAMLGGIGHAVVSAVEEAIFFHSVARYSQPEFQVKGDNPLTEHYSMLGPEVTEGPDGDRLGTKNRKLVDKLLTFDAVVVAGQAKSHCLAWTIDDLLEDDEVRLRLAARTYLLEDCTSPVVVPGAVDYTEQADDAFARYAAAGMHVVRSTQSIEAWPGMSERVLVRARR
jgi:nicotinamidase-related amidase